MLYIDYPYIRAYGKHYGWDLPKIEAEVRDAQKDEAPSDAVRKSGGRWLCFKSYDARMQEILTKDTK